MRRKSLTPAQLGSKKQSSSRYSNALIREDVEEHFASGKSELTFDEFATLVRENEPDATTDELKTRFAEFDANGDGSISKREWRLEKLVTAVVSELANFGPALAEAVVKWNEEHPSENGYSNTLDKVQFRGVLRSFKSTSIARCTDDDLDHVFKTLDDDGTGSLTYYEISRELQKLRPRASKSSGTCIPANVTLDAGKDPLNQLRKALNNRMEKVINLFQEWDKNSDGEVTRSEFARAMTLLSFDASKATIDALFDVIDTNQNGVIDYRELKRALATSFQGPLEPTAAAPAMAPAPEETPVIPMSCAKCASLEEERAMLQEQLRDAEQERDEVEDAKSNLAKELAELAARLHRTESEREEAKKDHAKDKLSAAERLAEVSARAAAEKEAEEKRRAEAERELNSVNQQLRTMRTELEHAQAMSKAGDERAEKLAETHRAELDASAAERASLEVQLRQTKQELSGALREVESTSEALAAAAASAEFGKQVLSRLNCELASNHVLASEIANLERDLDNGLSRGELEKSELQDQIARLRRSAKEMQEQSLDARQQALETQAARHAAAKAELAAELRAQHEREMQALKSQSEFEISEAKAREEARAKRDAELLARAEASCADAKRTAAEEAAAARRIEAAVRRQLEASKEEALVGCQEAERMADEEAEKARRAQAECERLERREAATSAAKAEEVAKAEAARDVALSEAKVANEKVDAMLAEASQARRAHAEAMAKMAAARDAALADAERARRAEANAQQDLVEARFLATMRTAADDEAMKQALERAEQADAELARARFECENARLKEADAKRAVEEARSGKAKAEAQTEKLVAEVESCREAQRLSAHEAETAKLTAAAATSAELDARALKERAITEREEMALELDRLRIEEEERRRAAEEVRNREAERAKRREASKASEDRDALARAEARADKATEEAVEYREKHRMALIELEAAKRAEEAARRSERLLAEKLESDTEKIAEAVVARDAAVAESDRARRSEAEARREAEEAKQREYNSRAATRHREAARDQEVAAEAAKVRAATQEADRYREMLQLAELEAESARKAEAASRRAEAEAKERKLDAEAREASKAKADEQKVIEAIAAREAAVALAARAQSAEAEARREADEAKQQAIEAIRTAEEEKRLFKIESEKAREAKREAQEAREREAAAKTGALSADRAIIERDTAVAEAARAKKDAEDARLSVEEARRREAETNAKKEDALRLAQETLMYCSQWRADRLAMLGADQAVAPTNGNALALQDHSTPKTRRVEVWTERGFPHAHPDAPPPLARFCECFECYDLHDKVHKQRREQLFSRFAGNSGRLSLSDTCGGIRDLLARTLGRSANVVYTRYYPAIINAFDDAKDTAIARPGHDDDEVITRSEFRLLLLFLCIYSTWYEVFAHVIDGTGYDVEATKRRRMDEEVRITRESWIFAVTRVRQAGCTWAPYIRLGDANAGDFDEMDTSRSGFVTFREFCEWVEFAEKAEGTPYGLALGVNEEEHSALALPNELRSPPPLPHRDVPLLSGSSARDKHSHRSRTKKGRNNQSEGRLRTPRESPPWRDSPRSAWLHQV